MKISLRNVRRCIQSFTGGIGAILIAFEIDFFTADKNEVLSKMGLIFALSIIFMFISHLLFMFLISICKLFYCKYKKYSLQTIAIFPFIINVKPKNIHIGNLFDFFSSDMTFLQYSILNKTNDLRKDFMNFDVAFNKIARYSAYTCVVVIVIFLSLYGKIAFAFIFLGSPLGGMLVEKEPYLYHGINNTFPKEATDLNIQRYILRHVCIEKFDKTTLYDEVLKILPTDENWTFLYHDKLVVESIIDSILDKKEYINPHEYKTYLRKNMQLINEQKPNTITILRYFYIYHFILKNTKEMEEILADMLYQRSFLENQIIFKKMQYKLVDRWITEMKEKKFSFVKDINYIDEKHFFIYQLKRKELETVVNAM